MNTIVINDAEVRQRIRIEAPKLVEQLQATAEKIVSTHNSLLLKEGRPLSFEKLNVHSFNVRQIIYPAITLEVRYGLDVSIDSCCWVTSSASSPTLKAHERQLSWRVVDDNLIFSDGERLMTVEEAARMLLEPVLSSTRG